MRRHLLILAAILAAVAGVVVLSLFRSPTLGLDRQGGLEVILQARAPQGREITQEDLDRSIEIMRQRIDKLGVAEPELRRQGNDQIIVELPGVHDAARAAEIVGTTAQLQFFKLEGDAVGPTKGSVDNPVIPNTSPLPLLTPESKLKAGDEARNGWYLYGNDKKLVAGPGETKQDVIDSIPGGTVTMMRLVTGTSPWPRHCGQGWLATRPRPRHCGQGRRTAKPPWPNVTSPRPLHSGQVVIVAPGAAPEPPHVGQASVTWTATATLPPSAATRSGISAVTSIGSGLSPLLTVAPFSWTSSIVSNFSMCAMMRVISASP